jgi:hypothetical protein
VYWVYCASVAEDEIKRRYGSPLDYNAKQYATVWNIVVFAPAKGWLWPYPTTMVLGRAESSNNLMMRSHQLGLGIIPSHAVQAIHCDRSRERKLLPLDYSSSNSQVIPTAVLGAANALHAYEPS